MEKGAGLRSSTPRPAVGVEVGVEAGVEAGVEVGIHSSTSSTRGRLSAAACERREERAGWHSLLPAGSRAATLTRDTAQHSGERCPLAVPCSRGSQRVTVHRALRSE